MQILKRMSEIFLRYCEITKCSSKWKIKWSYEPSGLIYPLFIGEVHVSWGHVDVMGQARCLSHMGF